MNARRVNDILKIVGAVVAGLALFAPVLSKPHANIGALIADLLTVLPGALGAFAAGMGTRGFGTEYPEVTEAKMMAKLSSHPPPPSSIAPTDPPTK